MKKGKKLRTASALSAVLMAGAIMNAVPAFAVNTIPVASTTPVVDTKTTFDKYLVMKKNANVPNATFSYTVSIPTDDEMKSLPNPEDTNKANLTVRKGIGSPTASDTKFTAGDQTFDSKQSVRTNKSSSAYNDAKEDQVTLGDNQKYAKHTSTVDFSNVTFSEPGVYRYKITENDTDEKGITNDPEATRYLDVYVESAENGTLSIKGYVFHTLNAVQPKGSKDESGKDVLGSNNPDGKNKGFENKYETKDLTLTKTVTGNQGFRDQYFKFHVDITNLDGGARLFLTDKDGNKPYKSTDTVAYEYNAGTGKRDGGQARFVAAAGTTIADIKTVKADNDNKTPDSTATTDKAGEADAQGLAITADDSGHAAFDVYLKHGESLKINGLTAGAKYTVKEISEDYTATVDGTKGSQALGLHHDSKEHSDTIQTQTLAGDETVTYTNNREGTLPTGIYHNNRAAFNIMGIAAAGGAIAIVIRKRRKNVEQALKNSNK